MPPIRNTRYICNIQKCIWMNQLTRPFVPGWMNQLKQRSQADLQRDVRHCIFTFGWSPNSTPELSKIRIPIDTNAYHATNMDEFIFKKLFLYTVIVLINISTQLFVERSSWMFSVIDKIISLYVVCVQLIIMSLVTYRVCCNHCTELGHCLIHF